LSDRNSGGLNKKNIAHSGQGDILGIQGGYDPLNQNRYINNAIKQSVIAEKYGLRPTVSNRAYGGDHVLSRNEPSARHNHSVQGSYPKPGLLVNTSNDSALRTGEEIMRNNSPYNYPMNSRNGGLHEGQNYSNPGKANISFPDTRMQAANMFGSNS
jgi:hypothetical protein